MHDLYSAIFCLLIIWVNFHNIDKYLIFSRARPCGREARGMTRVLKQKSMSTSDVTAAVKRHPILWDSRLQDYMLAQRKPLVTVMWDVISSSARCVLWGLFSLNCELSWSSTSITMRRFSVFSTRPGMNIDKHSLHRKRTIGCIRLPLYDLVCKVYSKQYVLLK